MAPPRAVSAASFAQTHLTVCSTPTKAHSIYLQVSFDSKAVNFVDASL
jgi:hypothetical protein